MARQRARRCRRELCGVRQGGRLRGRDRSGHDRGRHRRLRASSGEDAGDQAGFSVASAGDVNGDGFDDLIIGAFGGDGGGNAHRYAGDSYVVFGQAGGFAAEIDLAAIAAGTSGFVIHGEDAGDQSGCLGRLGGRRQRRRLRRPDRRGLRRRRPGDSRTDAGDSYVVFGKAGGFAAQIDLAALDGRQWRLRHPGRGCGRSRRPFGVRGGRRQWRRLRRPDHRGTHADGPGNTRYRARRQLRGVRLSHHRRIDRPRHPSGHRARRSPGTGDAPPTTWWAGAATTP